LRFLAVDIGNTSMHFAFHEGGKWRGHFSISTHANEAKLRALLRKNARALQNSQAAIASVVPAKTALLKRLLKLEFGIRAKIIGKDIPVRMVNRYRHPKQVGVDRLLNGLAAYRRYRKALVVIDFGTAITFDVVSKKGEYLGGVIAPGIEISIEALFKKTAMLPKIRLRHPKNWVGKDTVESIRVGCSVGIGGLCDRMVEAISQKAKMKPVVLATGGYASFMKRYCRSIQRVLPDLILDGILAAHLQKEAA
jgi:type III pantothenate kinase